MHKSIIYLLGLLVILMPIGTSMNIISNANAITENEYYTDKYMGYADDMVNHYEDESSYANDDGYGGLEQDRSSYENNNYDREYPSSKQDYNDEYKSYENNNDYKSKDKERSNSVSISKINCNSVNYNFNNVAIGNFTNGNSGIGGPAALGDGTNQGALNANANGNNQGYSNGYQNGKDITCIANINNNNTNISTGAAGNPTDQCAEDIEACFNEFLQPGELPILAEALEGGLTVEFALTGEIVTLFSFADICEALEGFDIFQLEQSLLDILDEAGIFAIVDQAFIDCVAEALGIEEDTNGIVVPFDIKAKPLDVQSDKKGSLTSFGIHNEGTGDLSALEKITKLKTQWLELLP